MSKTIVLRQEIMKIFQSLNCSVYFEKAPKGSSFPYLVYSFDTVNYIYDSRDDVFMLIDVWDRRESTTEVERLTDEVESLLGYLNHPDSKILATFYKESRMSVEDEDDLIKHRQLRVKIENYYIGG